MRTGARPPDPPGAPVPGLTDGRRERRTGRADAGTGPRPPRPADAGRGARAARAASGSDEGGSRPVSRVLSRAAIHLGRASPRASSDLPGSSAGHACRSPIRSCSGRGLPCHRCRHRRGALLPHLFTLTRAWRAVCFLWHFPWARAPQALPGALPCGARTFLPAARRGAAAARPTPAGPVSASRRLSASGRRRPQGHFTPTGSRPDVDTRRSSLGTARSQDLRRSDSTGPDPPARTDSEA